MKRGAPAKRQRHLELALLAMAERGHRRFQHLVEMGQLRDPLRLRHGGVVAARPQQREPLPRDAAAGDKDAVDHREPTEQLRDLVGPPQAAPDPLMHRERGDVLAEEADPPRASAGNRR